MLCFRTCEGPNPSFERTALPPLNSNVRPATNTQYKPQMAALLEALLQFHEGASRLSYRQSANRSSTSTKSFAIAVPAVRPSAVGSPIVIRHGRYQSKSTRTEFGPRLASSLVRARSRTSKARSWERYPLRRVGSSLSLFATAPRRYQTAGALQRPTRCTLRPNPAIERTCHSWLRQPWHAAHVQR